MNRLSRRALCGAVVAALLTALVAVLPATPAAAATTVKAQFITVQAASATSTTAQVYLWERDVHGIWSRIWGPATAFVGARGVGVAHEGLSRTPAGMFRLTQAFGNRPNPGTHLPYFLANAADWWNEEPSSPAYNTHVHQAASPGPNSENLYWAGSVYSRAVVIDYNRGPVVPGAGSGFFLHVSNGSPTAGCVSLPGAQLDQVLRWLNPVGFPRISIGVGSAAIAPLAEANAKVRARNPRGYFESVVALGGGRVRVGGWAFDPDSNAARLTVEITLGGTRVGLVSTGVPRADVARVFKVGPNQGFSGVVSVPRGARTLCATADNISGGTGNVALNCRPVTVT